MEHQRLRVLIADQDALARRMMHDVLEAAGLVVIGGARDGREAVELARHYSPEVLLVDIALPPAGAVDLIRWLAPIRDTRIVTVQPRPTSTNRCWPRCRRARLGTSTRTSNQRNSCAW